MYTVFHAAHEDAHGMPEVLNALYALMDDDIITDSDFEAYKNKRTQNIAKTYGAIYAALVGDSNLKMEFACDLMGAVMYVSQTGDESIYQRIGITGKVGDLANEAIKEALAFDPEIETDLDKTLAQNSEQLDDEVEFSGNDPFNGRSQVILDVGIDSSDFERNKVDVSQMGSVADLTGNEFPNNGESLKTRVTDYFDLFGNVVENPAIGEILATASSFHDDMGHGYGNDKIVTFAAIPQVLKDGKLVAYSKNWKGRNYDTAVLAAPITIGEKEYFMGIRVMRNAQSQRYEIHEVMAVDAEKSPEAFTSRPSTDGEVSRAFDDSSLNSILNQIMEYKRNSKILSQQRADDETDHSSNPIAASPEMRAKMEQAQKLFESGVHYLTYYNRTDADQNVGQMLRGLWDGADKADVLNRALALFKAGSPQAPYTAFHSRSPCKTRGFCRNTHDNSLWSADARRRASRSAIAC